MRLDILEEFVEAQSWVHADVAAAELRYAVRLKEQRERWEGTRRWKLKTDPAAKARRLASYSRDNKRRWQITRADPVKRAAHNAKRMAAYYRGKAAKSHACDDLKKHREIAQTIAKTPSKSRVRRA